MNQTRALARAARAAEENRTMITAIVQYKLPPHIDPAACAAHFRRIAPGFRDVPGLIRKQFIYAEDGWAGGVYLWQTRAAAEAFYAGPWLDGIRERYGMDPQIKLFETACITDNAIGAVLLPDAAGQPGASQRRLRQSTALHLRTRMKRLAKRAIPGPEPGQGPCAFHECRRRLITDPGVASAARGQNSRGVDTRVP